MATFNKDQERLQKLKECVLDLANPTSKRTHAAFLLRTTGSPAAAQIIAEAVLNREDSSLMRHELAYILGQMQYSNVCPILSNILQDETEDILVRHECAESLGAIGNVEYIPVLKEYSDHVCPDIAETCQIAVDLLSWRSKGEKTEKAEWQSVDPAPPLSGDRSVESLREDLKDASQSLFTRYRVMFSLRNHNSDEAALALGEGFNDSSALFRHEIAYVLGQMQREVSIDCLEKVLRNKSEHRMVRHEAAEALGAIGGDRCSDILEQFQDDGEHVVEESCQVALDTIDYWNTSEFE
jgi:deoxyhypusine monooxygenase